MNRESIITFLLNKYPSNSSSKINNKIEKFSFIENNNKKYLWIYVLLAIIIIFIIVYVIKYLK